MLHESKVIRTDSINIQNHRIAGGEYAYDYQSHD